MVTKRAIRLKDLSRPWRVALALSLFLHSCDGESGRTTAAVYDSAGVRIVENRDVEGNRTSSWTVSPEATLHLGGTSAIARKLEVDSVAREFDMQAGSGPRTVLRVHLDGDEASESEVARASRPDVEEDFHFAALPNGRVAYSDTTAYLIKVTDPAGNVDRVLVRSFTPRNWDDRTARAFRKYLGTSIDEAIAGGGGRARLIGSSEDLHFSSNGRTTGNRRARFPTSPVWRRPGTGTSGRCALPLEVSSMSTTSGRS